MPLPPHVPDEEEFVAGCLAYGKCMASGTPEAYIRAQFSKFQGNDAWLTARGTLCDFRELVAGRWILDRGSWKAPVDPLLADVKDLEARLKTEMDPAARARLREALRVATEKRRSDEAPPQGT